MAHEIFGDRFFGNRAPAWHGLGKVFTGKKTAMEAIAEGGLDYEVVKAPIVTETKWGCIDTGKVALVREPLDDDPQPRTFAVVHPDYGLIQNRQIGEMLNDVSKEWEVETAGALGYGERIFLTLRVGGTTIGGDECNEFFLLYETKDGTGGITIAYTNVRVVCNNTLVMALGGSFDSVKINHTVNVEERLKFEAELMVALRRSQEQAVGTLHKLAETKITPKQAKAVFNAAWPNPPAPRGNRFKNIDPKKVREELLLAEHARAEKEAKNHAYRTNRYQEFREALGDLYEQYNRSFPKSAGTAWAALNAVTELEDHRQLNNKEDQSTRFSSALWGDRADRKSAALAACVQIASGRDPEALPIGKKVRGGRAKAMAALSS